MKKLWVVAFLITLGITDSGAEKYRQLSENGGPLSLAIVEARETREPQTLKEQTGLGIPLSAMAAGGTYRGPLEQLYSLNPIPLSDSESFLIVKVDVTGVNKHKLFYLTSDVVLVDKHGARLTPIGCCPNQKNGTWLSLKPSQFNPAGGAGILEPRQHNVSTLLYKVNTDTIRGGMSIRIQDAEAAVTASR